MSSELLQRLLGAPLAPADPAVLAELAEGPVDPARADRLEALDRLLDPAPLPCENGWCTLPDGVGYVAVRTAMPAVSGEMVDWWFDWHPREALRYRVWHPAAHRSNRLQEPAAAGAKRHWGAVHHPVEDIGGGDQRLRIAFLPPSRVGFSTDALELPAVATVVCGIGGEDARPLDSTVMCHVFLREGPGTVLRSRFWLGARIRPRVPLGGLLAPLLNTRRVRRAAMPAKLPAALAQHCAEEYANLAAILPELYAAYCPGA